MQRNSTLAIFAVIAALGLLSIIVLEMTVFNQEVSAGCENAPFNTAVIKSDGKCLGSGN